MGIDKLISMSVILALLAAGTGQLPRVINTLRRAQFQLIQDTKASKWPKAPLLEPNKKSF